MNHQKIQRTIVAPGVDLFVQLEEEKNMHKLFKFLITKEFEKFKLLFNTLKKQIEEDILFKKFLIILINKKCKTELKSLLQEIPIGTRKKILSDIGKHYAKTPMKFKEGGESLILLMNTYKNIMGYEVEAISFSMNLALKFFDDKNTEAFDVIINYGILWQKNKNRVLSICLDRSSLINKDVVKKCINFMTRVFHEDLIKEKVVETAIGFSSVEESDMTKFNNIVVACHELDKNELILSILAACKNILACQIIFEKHFEDRLKKAEYCNNYNERAVQKIIYEQLTVCSENSEECLISYIDFAEIFFYQKNIDIAILEKSRLLLDNQSKENYNTFINIINACHQSKKDELLINILENFENELAYKMILEIHIRKKLSEINPFNEVEKQEILNKYLKVCSKTSENCIVYYMNFMKEFYDQEEIDNSILVTAVAFSESNEMHRFRKLVSACHKLDNAKIREEIYTQCNETGREIINLLRYEVTSNNHNIPREIIIVKETDFATRPQRFS
jgi:hypothetical protein